MAEDAPPGDLLDRLGTLILIGMPGSGKSTLGKLLAERLGASLVDTDQVIEDHFGTSLQALIDSQGLDGFLKAEETALLRAEIHGGVLSTGGSVVYSEAVMERLQRTGTIIWLAATCAHLQQRIHNMEQRGLAMRPGQTFEKLFDERFPLYKRWADIVLHCPNCDPETSVEELLLRLQSVPDLRHFR